MAKWEMNTDKKTPLRSGEKLYDIVHSSLVHAAYLPYNGPMGDRPDPSFERFGMAVETVPVMTTPPMKLLGRGVRPALQSVWTHHYLHTCGSDIDTQCNAMEANTCLLNNCHYNQTS